jgi:hypothetical protein
MRPGEPEQQPTLGDTDNSQGDAAKARAQREAAKAKALFDLAKVLMIVAALAAGGLLFRALAFETVQVGSYGPKELRPQELPCITFIILFAISLAAAFAYPFVGAVVVTGAAALRSWAWRHEEPPKWDRTARLFLGAFWPLTLAASIIIYIFLGVIHRIF